MNARQAKKMILKAQESGRWVHWSLRRRGALVMAGVAGLRLVESGVSVALARGEVRAALRSPAAVAGALAY